MKSATISRREIEETITDYLEFVYQKYLSAKVIDETVMPTHKELMCKAALEVKFNKKFSLKELREILKDKSWQWRTPSQAREVLREGSVTAFNAKNLSLFRERLLARNAG